MLRLPCLLTAIVTASLVTLGCSSSSSPTGTSTARDGGTTASGDVDAGGVTFACTTESGALCTQILGPASAQAGEKQACGVQSGSFAVGTCPTKGVVGECNQGIEQQLYYDTVYAEVGKEACSGAGRTWTGLDAGSLFPLDGGL